MRVKDLREKNAMRAVRSLVVVVLAFVVFAVPSVVLADGRVALVVGNSTYAHIGRLPNPDNDARDMSAALRRLGFEVTTELDADRVELTEALRAFTRRSAGAEVSLVFYAGHGIEMDGVNYLVPVDARLERDVDVRFETVTVDDLLVSTTGASLRLVILDACRNNPLVRSMQRTAATRTVSGGSFADLNEDLLGDETLVAYAAAAGTTAADGRGRNSPYTAALLAYLEEPVELLTLFRRVRARVLASTNGEQRPHEYASLLGEHYLGGTPTSGTVVVAAGAPTDALVERENLFWQSIANSEDPADFRAYLAQYPDGAFALLARNRVVSLGAVGGDPPIVERPRPSRPPVEEPPRPTGLTREFRDCDDCPEMVVIPAGRFRMGCVSGGDDCDRNERPVHEVDVASFALSKYEVTFEDYERFVAAKGHRWPDAEGWGRGDRPVINVSWDDAVAYASWLSEETGEEYRLPSESEWEYAARAGTTTRYSWGPDLGRNRGNCFRCGSRWDADRTAPVGSFAANPWGLHDVHGNVDEWVQDCWHGNYRGAPADGSAWQRSRGCGFGPDLRVYRGGSWSGYWTYLRSANRRGTAAGSRYNHVGFRVSRTLD